MQAELMGVSSTPQDLLLEILTSQMHLRRMHLLLFASCIRPLRVIPGKGGGGASSSPSTPLSYVQAFPHVPLPTCYLPWCLHTSSCIECIRCGCGSLIPSPRPLRPMSTSNHQAEIRSSLPVALTCGSEPRGTWRNVWDVTDVL